MNGTSRLQSLMNGLEKDIIAEPVIIGMGASVRVDFDDHYHLVFLSGGIELMFDKWTNRLKSIFVRPSAEEYAKSNSLMPLGLAFGFSRFAVRQTLGNPDRECKPGAKTILGKIQPWDIYMKDGIKVNVQYSWDEALIDMVTVIST